MNKLMELTNINKAFPNKKHVLKDVSISIMEASIHCLVGESGCGKTTLCSVMTGLITPDSGQIQYQGHPLGSLRKRALSDCHDMQYIFQDPYSSINTAWTVEKVLMEPLRLCKRSHRNTLPIQDALELVGLDPLGYRNRATGTLSGGERQRLAIARALIPNPRMIIADECTSMLDESASEDLCRLFSTLRSSHSITFLVVTHNLGVLQYFPESVIMMHEGSIVEQGCLSQLTKAPLHPYTRLWVNSMASIEGELFHE